MQQFKITYTRHHVTGNLGGLSSKDQYIRTTGDALHLHLAALHSATEANPKTDFIGNVYWVSDISITEEKAR